MIHAAIIRTLLAALLSLQMASPEATQHWDAARRAEEQKLFDVAVRDVNDKLEISAPTEVMTLPADSVVIAILPDGKRTLVARSTSDQTAGSLDLLLNWQGQLH